MFDNTSGNWELVDAAPLDEIYRDFNISIMILDNIVSVGCPGDTEVVGKLTGDNVAEMADKTLAAMQAFLT